LSRELSLLGHTGGSTPLAASSAILSSLSLPAAFPGRAGTFAPTVRITTMGIMGEQLKNHRGGFLYPTITGLK